VSPGRFKLLGLPDEILELPPIFIHPEPMSYLNVILTITKTSFSKTRRKLTFIAKKWRNGFFGYFFQESPFISVCKR
jgi:hypothetical protein